MSAAASMLSAFDVEEPVRRTRADLQRSDTELTLFYTSSLGVSAQPYESSGGRSSVNDFDKGIVHEIDAASMSNRETRTQAHDAVRATLRQLSSATRQTLLTIYEPWGTGFVASRKSLTQQTVVRRSAAEEPVAPDFLSIALQPRWGGGSFVRLALAQARTLAAFTKRYTAHATRSALLQFLVAEAGRGRDAAPFFRKLVEDCEQPRMRAIEAYDAMRVARLDEEKKQRRARRDAAAKDSAQFGFDLRAKPSRAAKRQHALATHVVDLAREIRDIASDGDAL